MSPQPSGPSPSRLHRRVSVTHEARSVNLEPAFRLRKCRESRPVLDSSRAGSATPRLGGEHAAHAQSVSRESLAIRAAMRIAAIILLAEATPRPAMS